MDQVIALSGHKISAMGVVQHCTQREIALRRKEERTGSIWQKADTNFQNQLGCPSATDSEFHMGLAGKKSK
ncbi:hypothetical protein ACQP3J_31205, partial [Escherichia coli]